MLPISVADQAKIPLFAGIPEQEREQLLAAGRLRKCPAGSMLFVHGDPVSHFYVLVSGTMQLFRATADGAEKTVHIIRPGQTMGEGEILDACHGYRLSALAVSEATVLEFPMHWLKETARKHGAFALNLLSLIAQQAYLAEVEAEHQASMSAPQLVACFLQRLCILYDFDPKGFELPYSKTLIASRLGMELETLSRTLSKLKENGITVSGTRVTIHDLERIEEYVCASCSVAESCTTHKVMQGIVNNSLAPKKPS